MKQKIRTYAELVFIVVLVILTFKYLQQFEWLKELKPKGSTEKYIGLAGSVLAILIALAIHELGHLITGLAQGFSFQLFVIGPLGIKREDEKIKVYFNKELGYYGGVAASTPVNDDPENAKKFGNLILAGPIASFVFAIIFIVLSTNIGKPYSFTCFLTGFVSFGLFLATTIPTKTGMFFTDRKKYQRLTTPGKDQDVELATLRIIGSYSKNGGYKEVAKSDILELVTDKNDFIKFYGLFNLLCFQNEIEKEIDPTTLEEYRMISKEMSKSLVIAFNKELEKNLKLNTTESC